MSALTIATAERMLFSRSLYRAPVLKTLTAFSVGRLEMQLPDGETLSLGQQARQSKMDTVPRITVRDEAFFKKCALGGGVGLGESYVVGDWDTDDIKGVIEWFILNLHADKNLRGSSQKLRLVGFLSFLDRIGHRLRHNSKETSRRNIEEHYDLGNAFYKLWLDPSMTYSAARYTAPDQGLEEAQRAKYDALCEKLQLKASDHVLEIGCGWGGFSCHAVQHFGCRVTAVTISQAQFNEATRRVKDAGLEDKIEIRLQDYRDITGQFDKIASIEMLEAVGHNYHKTWAAKCHEVLKPQGLLAVQMITVADGEYADLKRGTDFIQKHIFPGSLLLSVGRMGEVFKDAGNFLLYGMEDLGISYARTLNEWHVTFNQQLDAVRSLGFSDQFIRKWNYYLKYCEAAFATRNISVIQAVYTRPCNTSLRD
ncbi:MAG: cyclopropane-fatty-acyl-phospholipid synthase [Verrucomicrobia bacterium]|nr:cyclopropane-fatty-acyl-phospholipid synthase [Verrucomicrobiota bacterium]